MTEAKESFYFKPANEAESKQCIKEWKEMRFVTSEIFPDLRFGQKDCPYLLASKRGTILYNQSDGGLMEYKLKNPITPTEEELKRRYPDCFSELMAGDKLFIPNSECATIQSNSDNMFPNFEPIVGNPYGTGIDELKLEYKEIIAKLASLNLLKTNDKKTMNTMSNLSTTDRLLWNVYYKANEKSIVRLLEEANDLVEKITDKGINPKNIGRTRGCMLDIGSAIDEEDKVWLKSTVNELKVHVEMLKSPQYSVLEKATTEYIDTLEKKMTKAGFKKD